MQSSQINIFGARNDSLHFINFYESFYNNIFFPILDKEGITNLVILGDTFDRRKYVNFYSLQRAKKMFFDKLLDRNIKVYMLIGNHDTYYRNTNSVNSPELLLLDYPNIQTIGDPEEIEIDGLKICMMPWICAENYDKSIKLLEETRAEICMGHFEIEGFQMYRGAPSQEGLERNLFQKFDMTFSGHYHHKSSSGNIHYLGNPYELTWQDYNDPKGFHLFDTTTRVLKFVQNTYKMFHRIVYDDKIVDMKKITDMDLTSYKGNYVKVIVANKTNPYLFDVFMNNLYNAGTIDITIAEDLIEEIDDESEVDETEDTTTILTKYVDNMSTELSKDKLKTLLREVYVEALNEETA